MLFSQVEEEMVDTFINEEIRSHTKIFIVKTSRGKR